LGFEVPRSNRPVAASENVVARAPAGAGRALCLLNRHARSGDVDPDEIAGVAVAEDDGDQPKR